MFEVALLYPDKQQGAAKRYGMPQDMGKDLNLSVILRAMAKEDEEIFTNCQRVLLCPVTDEKTLHFRQQMVSDAVSHPEFYKEMYRIAKEAMQEIHKYTSKKTSNKVVQITESLDLLRILLKYLRYLKEHLRSEQAEKADAMYLFTTKFREHFTDDFAKDLERHIDDMAVLMQGGRLILTAGVAGGLKCGDAMVNRLDPVDYRKMGKFRRTLRWLLLHLVSPEAILLNQEALKQDAIRMEENGLLYTQEIYREFLYQFQEFFSQLQIQVGFYVGCANLGRSLHNLKMKTCYPRVSHEKGHIEYQHLYELGLALETLKNPVDNSLTDSCHLHVISGANQGGKSTFLRSVGIAQVMMQAGMFVPAVYFESPLYDNILTHFTRREDSSMNSGRLDEEMKRVNRIVDMVTDRSLILFNESFSSTTEKEGSQIAEHIIQAMYDSGVSVFMVTHLFAFASQMYAKNLQGARFLSAERKEDGTRTFKMIDHEPTETSYGLDLYAEIIERKE